MRRTLAFLVVLMLGLGSILAACTSVEPGPGDAKPAADPSAAKPPAADTAKPSEDRKGDITIALTWNPVSDPVKAAWMNYLIEPFQKENPDIKVDFRTIPNALSAVKVQIASGEGPDFFMADAFDLKNFVDADMIIPLDKYVQQYGWDKTIFPWAMKAGQYKGHQYGVPRAYETSHLLYNKDLLDSNGWPIPKTRAEFEKINEEALKKGLIPISYGNASAPLLNQWLYNHYLSSYAGANAVKELFKGKKKFTDSDIKGAFDLLNQDWQKGWYNNKNSAAITINDARSLFYNQKAVFSTEGTWLTSAIRDDVIKFNFGATAWPSMKDGMPPASGVGHGKAIAVTKSSKNPDAVAKFLNFMYTQKELGAKAAAEGVQPLPLDTPDNMIPKDGHKGVAIMLQATREATKNPAQVGGYLPWTFYPAKTNQFLYENLDGVFYGKMSLDDYLKKAQELLDGELKEGFQFAAD